MSPKPPVSTRAWFGLTLFAIGVLWIGIGLTIRGDFRAAAALALQDTANLAHTLESQIAGRVENIDAILRFAQTLYARDPANFALGRWSEVGRNQRDVLAVLVDAEGFGWADARGRITPPLDLRNRPNIAAHLADPTNVGLLIGQPMAGPLTGRPIVAFSRALHRADGGFGGVMVLAVGIGLVSELQQALDLEDSRILVAGLNGVVLARAPEAFGTVGQHLPDQVLAPFIAGVTEVSERTSSAIDGADSFITRRRVAGYPLLVAVSLSADLILTQSRWNRDAWLAFAALVSLLAIVLCRVLTHQHQVERASRATLEGAFANVGHGIMMIDVGGRVVLANDRVSRLLGLPPGLIASGRPISEIVAWLDANGELGDLVPQALGDRTSATPSGAPLRWERVQPDGSVLQVRVEHLADGSNVCTWTDVTEAHRAAAAVAAARDAAEAARADLNAAFENAPFGIALVGADRRLEFMSSLAIAMLDLPVALARPGALGGDILRFQIDRGDLATTPELAAAANRALLLPLETGTAYERSTRDGRKIEVRINTLPDARVIRTYADVSDRHAALREHVRAREAAEAALRSRTTFVASVGQELYAPLEAIIRLIEALLMQGPAPHLTTDLQLMQEAGRRLFSLVDDIMDLARLESGQLFLAPKAFAPCPMLEGTAALIRPRAEAQGLEFHIQLDATLPEVAIGDEDRLRQVVVKLLENAVKFTRVGCIELSASLLADDVVSWRLGIAVADTGVGIPAAALSRLFEPFTQADSSRSRRYEGAGLGLAVCRKLLEAMGGSISVESEEGCGSIFRCEVPLRRAAVTADPPAVAGQVADHSA